MLRSEYGLEGDCYYNVITAGRGRKYKPNPVLPELFLWLDYDAVEPDVMSSYLPSPMSFEMEDLRERKENPKSSSDAEQSSASITERIDNSVTIWAGVAATWSVDCGTKERSLIAIFTGCCSNPYHYCYFPASSRS